MSARHRPNKPPKCVVKTGVREDEPCVRHRRLGEHHRDISLREGRFEGVDIVEPDDPGLTGDRAREPVLFGSDLAVLQHDEGGIAMAVVLPIEQQHDLATGRRSGQSDDFRIRLRRRPMVPRTPILPVGAAPDQTRRSATR